MKKTVYISERKQVTISANDRFGCPVVFWDKWSKKWREDCFYFDDPLEFEQKMKKEGYQVK